MNPLEQACLDHCKRRWDELSADPKHTLHLDHPEVAAFAAILWTMQFYRERATIVYQLREGD